MDGGGGGSIRGPEVRKEAELVIHSQEFPGSWGLPSPYLLEPKLFYSVCYEKIMLEIIRYGSLYSQ